MHYVLWNCLDEFKPISSQEKKGSLNSEITPQIFTTLLLWLWPLSKEYNDSEEQGSKATPKTFIFLVMKMNFIGETNSTEPLPKLQLYTFPLKAFSPPIMDLPVAPKPRSGDGQTEYDWWKQCVLKLKYRSLIHRYYSNWSHITQRVYFWSLDIRHVISMVKSTLNHPINCPQRMACMFCIDNPVLYVYKCIMHIVIKVYNKWHMYKIRFKPFSR